jgi:hypothetical protein
MKSDNRFDPAQIISHRVDFFRGNRDYLRAADVLSAAPFETPPDSFQFFFKKIARHSGEWKKQDNGPGSSAAPTAAASLTMTFAQRKEKWDFIIDEPGLIIKRSPDIDETSLLADFRLTEEEFVCTLAGAFPLWDFLVAAARAGGLHFFPDTQWYLPYITGNQDCFPAQLEGLPLTLRLGRRRAGFVEINFALGNRTAGKLGLFRKEDS